MQGLGVRIVDGATRGGLVLGCWDSGAVEHLKDASSTIRCIYSRFGVGCWGLRLSHIWSMARRNAAW